MWEDSYFFSKKLIGQYSYNGLKIKAIVHNITLPRRAPNIFFTKNFKPPCDHFQIRRSKEAFPQEPVKSTAGQP